MGVLSGTHEIVELEEQHDSKSKIIANAGKQHTGSLLKKHSIEDDINKLFEAIEIGNSRRLVGKPEKRVKDDFSRSAMKRPMRFGSGIGISEPVSLKQALRGLCISQASEMAAVKKRMSRVSASPGVLESVAIKKLYEGLATEAGQYKGNLVEILLIPEKRSSEFSDKGPEFGHLLTPEITQDANMTEPKAEGDITPFQSSVGCELSEAESEQSKNLELVHSSVSAAFDQKFPVLDEISPGMDENPSIFNVQRKPTKTSPVDFSSSKPSLRRQNIMKKKIAQKTTAAKSKSQHNKGADSVHQYHTSELVLQTPDSIKECEESEKVSPVASRTRKMAMTIAYERSRSNEKGDISESSQSSIGEYISTTSNSEESYLSVSSRSGYRPHMSSDLRWEAMTCVQKRHGSLSLRHFKLLRKLGGGDIGTVYLSELIGTSCLFAVKVMNNDVLVGKKKMLRAQTEKEILEILDHPFLPTLYAHFARNKFSCLVMEYCPGGDLHVLRQKQPTKCFSEPAARFYVAEVVVALEYLHMMGVVYRDLKPENVLVREDGHIMLSDFDLSLRCSTNPTLIKSPSPLPHTPDKISNPGSEPSCTDPFCLQPSWNLPCFSPTASNFKTRKLKSEQVIHFPQLLVEPTSARSNSFVGTHEYLAPEIIKGEGHGSAVDWWMLGIFLYELLYGKTPFKGLANEDTISNVVSQCLKFPECSMLSSEGRDLIGRLLSKEPENRLGSVKGAVEIKQHPFFDGLNWALIRCETPPELPKFFDLENVVIPDVTRQVKANEEDTEFVRGGDGMEFEIF